MADLETNLKNYQLQLQQVEAALLVDPENEELLKLQKDLQEVTDLTLDLVSSELAKTAAAGEGEASTSGEGASASSSTTQSVNPSSWNVGDTCMAVYAEDGKEYEAKIEEILVDGTCSITFDGYDNAEVVQLSELKPVDTSQARGVKRPHGGAAGGGGGGANMSKKDLMAQQRDYKKKKSQKKAQRWKDLEEEREQDKNKWQSFNSKLFTKGSKGAIKKSIFASPEANTGKVGVGTCGVGGKPMTSYHQNEKWKKGAMN